MCVRKGQRDRERFGVLLQYAQLLLRETETQPRSLPPASPHALKSQIPTPIPSARDQISPAAPGSDPDGSLSSLTACSAFPTRTKLPLSCARGPQRGLAQVSF